MRQKVKLLENITYIAVLTALCLPVFYAATAGAEELSATPSTLVFQRMGQVETVALSADGEALSAHTISGWRLLVDGNVYNHMLRITPTDEGLRIRLSETVEVGSYTLVITTPHGSIAIQVFTPLSEQQSGIESLAQRMKIGIGDLRKQMGMTQRLGRDQITLGLLPVCYYGQRIQIAMPDAGKRDFLWKVNGEIVQKGTGENNFEYAAKETGPVLIAYEELENGTIAATTATLTEIVKEPAILYNTKPGIRTHFEAPPGFSEYTWLLDGVGIGTGAAIEHVFEKPGKSLVELIAKNPIASVPYLFREVRYNVVISSNSAPSL